MVTQGGIKVKEVSDEVVKRMIEIVIEKHFETFKELERLDKEG